ncbi:MAG TPA: RNA 2',3'-cyclic phosphodiesterase [Pyrinomonadaceae bacterium]|jgi:2'-5' RNA ligase|nr:RNA 2',3'-cyclic phosphodiesterase [Pyrinomonadaceae bacterium]
MPDKSETLWRTFCAVELPDGVKSRVAEHIERLRAEFPHVRASWEKSEKLHITLKFLGEIELPRVEDLSGAAERAAASAKPFGLTIAEAGAFPPHGQPRVLWLDIKDASGMLASLQHSLEDACAAAGFQREPRPFKPHLTVARLRSPHGARELAAAHREASFEPQAFPVSELLVMRSKLGPGGSRYSIVSRQRFFV